MYVDAPMGAIAKDYMAHSDLSLHTGCVISIYIYKCVYTYSIYIYMKSLQGNICFSNTNLNHN